VEVEVWQTSNLRRLRLGEEKDRKKKKNKHQDENIMSPSATQGGHNDSDEIISRHCCRNAPLTL